MYPSPNISNYQHVAATLISLIPSTHFHFLLHAPFILKYYLKHQSIISSRNIRYSLCGHISPDYVIFFFLLGFLSGFFVKDADNLMTESNSGNV